uniref:Uncharacterized protein n=1 Tax=Branchiostoma floridae TaxID=7739 RepID=C3ZGE6_BRAFL|eukprot:XP_002592379.1 hypothetical protein BRAFLDRAFT_67240 [Branchiostoma floridae]
MSCRSPLWPTSGHASDVTRPVQRNRALASPRGSAGPSCHRRIVLARMASPGLPLTRLQSGGAKVTHRPPKASPLPGAKPVGPAKQGKVTGQARLFTVRKSCPLSHGPCRPVPDWPAIGRNPSGSAEGWLTPNRHPVKHFFEKRSTGWVPEPGDLITAGYPDPTRSTPTKIGGVPTGEPACRALPSGLAQRAGHCPRRRAPGLSVGNGPDQHWRSSYRRARLPGITEQPCSACRPLPPPACPRALRRQRARPTLEEFLPASPPAGHYRAALLGVPATAPAGVPPGSPSATGPTNIGGVLTGEPAYRALPSGLARRAGHCPRWRAPGLSVGNGPDQHWRSSCRRARLPGITERPCSACRPLPPPACPRALRRPRARRTLEEFLPASPPTGHYRAALLGVPATAPAGVCPRSWSATGSTNIGGVLTGEERLPGITERPCSACRPLPPPACVRGLGRQRARPTLEESLPARNACRVLPSGLARRAGHCPRRRVSEVLVGNGPDQHWRSPYRRARLPGITERPCSACRPLPPPACPRALRRQRARPTLEEFLPASPTERGGPRPILNALRHACNTVRAGTVHSGPVCRYFVRQCGHMDLPDTAASFSRALTARELHHRDRSRLEPETQTARPRLTARPVQSPLAPPEREKSPDHPDFSLRGRVPRTPTVTVEPSRTRQPPAETPAVLLPPYHSYTWPILNVLRHACNTVRVGTVHSGPVCRYFVCQCGHMDLPDTAASFSRALTARELHHRDRSRLGPETQTARPRLTARPVQSPLAPPEREKSPDHPDFSLRGRVPRTPTVTADPSRTRQPPAETRQGPTTAVP